MTRLSVDQRLDTGRESDDLTSMAKRFSSDIGGKFNKTRVFSKQPKRTVLKRSWVNGLAEGAKKPSSLIWDKVISKLHNDIVDTQEREFQKVKENCRSIEEDSSQIRTNLPYMQSTKLSIIYACSSEQFLEN